MAEEKDTSLIDEVRENFTLKTFQEKVWRLESENKDLKVNNSILHTQYTSQCETQSDILRHLHANLDENYSKIEELQGKVSQLEGDLEDQKQKAKDELEAERAQWNSKVGLLNTEKERLEGELEKVREFRENKAQMEADLANLKAKLRDQADEHQRNVSAFDRKKAIEIDQLKQDMRRSIKETKEMLRNRTKDQLDTTTKRTIMENEQMATELHFQSKETERLLTRNQSLMDENAQLKRNLVIHKDLENELARRTHVYQKLVKKMGQRKKADDQLPANLSGFEDPSITQEESRELSGMLSASDGVVADENEKLKRQVEGIQSTLQMVRQEFATYRRDHATLTQLQDQSTRLIIATLYELKNQRESGEPFPPASYDEKADWQFGTMTGRQKEYFFRVLLEKLNSSMCGTCFPAGGHQHGGASNASLPPLGKSGEVSHPHNTSGAHFSQFLWSVATHGGQPAGGGPRKDTASQGCQTETDPTDPCFREGFWNPQSRSRFNDASTVSPAMVCGSVRSWGSTAPPRASRSQLKGRAV